MPASGTVPVQQASALRSDLINAEDQIRQLEQQLAERDRQIAAVQGQIDAARSGSDVVASNASDSPAGTARAATRTAEPVAAPAPAAVADAAAHSATAEDLGSTAGVAGATAPEGAAGQAAIGADERVAEAQKRIGKLQQQLAVEVKRRQDVEAEMSRVLQETSAGPFEHADNVVEKHLHEELDRAHKEIDELRTTLLTERRERADLERRFGALQAQAQTAANAAPAAGVPSEEVEALKERQRRVLASIEQDLEASKQREAELRQRVEQSQGPDGVALAEAVTNLRSENSALQARLDEEHQHNGDLSAKLQLATRVTDLIFKMQTVGAQRAVASAPPAGR